MYCTAVRQEREQVSAPAITPTPEPGASESNALGNLVDAFYARYYEGCGAVYQRPGGYDDGHPDIFGGLRHADIQGPGHLWLVAVDPVKDIYASSISGVAYGSGSITLMGFLETAETTENAVQANTAATTSVLILTSELTQPTSDENGVEAGQGRKESTS